MLEAAAERFDGTDALDGWTLEVSFDTAEETDMNMLYYLDAVGAPGTRHRAGCVLVRRAEKGIERPIFSIPLGDGAAGKRGLQIQNAGSAITRFPIKPRRVSKDQIGRAG